MEDIQLRETFIKLGQAVKASGIADSGAQAKEVIQNGYVKVNGVVEFRRGRKLYAGDSVEYRGQSFVIK